MNARIEYDARALQRVAESFPKAASSALNKTILKARTALNRYVRDTYNITAATLNKAFTIKKATARELVAGIYIRGTKTPLIQFSAVKPTTGKRMWARVRVKKSSGTKTVEGFYATMPSGHLGIYMRKTDNKSLPIRELFTLAISEMVNSKEGGAVVKAIIDQDLEKILENEIRYFQR